jgi:hypothetical protein
MSAGRNRQNAWVLGPIGFWIRWRFHGTPDTPLSMMTTEEIGAEISTLLSRLRTLMAQLEINAKNAESLVPSLRKAVTDQQAQHAAEIAKLTKLHAEEMARVTEPEPEQEPTLGDLRPPL